MDPSSARRPVGAHAPHALALALFLLLGAAQTAGAAPVRSDARSAALRVSVTGLPSGERIDARLRGPGVNRRVRGRGLVIARARAGTYVLTLRPIVLRRSHGTIKRDAIATPKRRTVRLKVRSGRGGRLRGRYSTIVNPGLVPVQGSVDVLEVRGPAENPTSVFLAGRHDYEEGDVLSVSPRSGLPQGMLSRVLGSLVDGASTMVTVRAAPVQEVVPVLEFDVPLEGSEAAGLRAASCGSPSGVWPYRRIRNIAFSGGWNTTRFLGRDIKTGLRAKVGFDVEAGIDARGAVGIDCAIRVSVSASGMAGPIPITAAIEGELTSFVGAGGRLSAGGSVRVEASVSTLGVPPAMVWAPSVDIGRPSFNLSAEAFAEARAGIGLAIKAGLGNDALASATVKFGSSLEFSAKPGRCAWDGRFGEFSVQGKILGFTVESPRTPPLFTKNLWQNACGASSGGGGSPSPGTGPPGQTPAPTATPKPSTPPPSSTPAPQPQPQPQPQPTVKGFTIWDSYLGGTWARTDPNNGTWYSQGNRPANGAYWYGNGLGVGVDCARRAAGYTVSFADGRKETWNVWFHVTDGKWYPSAASKETTVNDTYGLAAC